MISLSVRSMVGATVASIMADLPGALRGRDSARQGSHGRRRKMISDYLIQRIPESGSRKGWPKRAGTVYSRGHPRTRIRYPFGLEVIGGADEPRDSAPGFPHYRPGRLPGPTRRHDDERGPPYPGPCLPCRQPQRRAARDHRLPGGWDRGAPASGGPGRPPGTEASVPDRLRPLWHGLPRLRPRRFVAAPGRPPGVSGDGRGAPYRHRAGPDRGPWAGGTRPLAGEAGPGLRALWSTGAADWRRTGAGIRLASGLLGEHTAECGRDRAWGSPPATRYAATHGRSAGPYRSPPPGGCRRVADRVRDRRAAAPGARRNRPAVALPGRP